MAKRKRPTDVLEVQRRQCATCIFRADVAAGQLVQRLGLVRFVEHDK